MALTASQNIPERPKVESEPWTVRKLFPLNSVTTTLSKVILNVFDALLAYLILILGACVLVGRDVSWGFWVLALSLVVADLIERRVWVIPEVPKKKK